MLTLEDKFAIHELIALYGHIIDERQFSRTGELFTADAVYDVSDFKGGRHVGVAAIKTLWEKSSTHPLAHHATNIVIEVIDGTVRVLSKGIGILPGNGAGSVTYRDIVVKTPQGWRMSERVAILRRPSRIPQPS